MNSMILGTMISALMINTAIVLAVKFGWFALALNVFVVWSFYNNFKINGGRK